MKSPRQADVSNESTGHSSRVSNGDLQTRDLLILAALKLFARYGFDGVSLRQISAEAQQLNQSVVHYYFQSKNGLIAAVLDYVATQLQPMQQAADENIREMVKLRQPTVREIVSAAVVPIVAWNVYSAVGRRSIRFLSRLMWQADQEEFDLLVVRCLPFYEAFVDYLHGALPGSKRDVVAAKVLFAMINLVHGLAATRVAVRSSALTGSRVNEMDPNELLGHFIDYIAGGIGSVHRE